MAKKKKKGQSAWEKWSESKESKKRGHVWWWWTPIPTRPMERINEMETGGNNLSFTIFIHREVSDDNWGGVGWWDHRHIWGRCITTGHWHRIPRGQPRDTRYILNVSFTLIGWGRGVRAALLWQQLLLDRGDVNHRVGVDFELGVGRRGGNHTGTSVHYWSESTVTY